MTLRRIAPLCVWLMLAPGISWALPLPRISAQIIEESNFTPEQRAKLHRVLALFESVMNSPQFRDRVLDFGEFDRNQGLSNEEILLRIHEGSEKFVREPEFDPRPRNHVADFFLRLFQGRRGLVGYTNKGRRTIHINTRYFNSSPPAYLAGNLAHEWMHKLGFSHDFRRTRERPRSVPYGIGGIVRSLAFLEESSEP